MREDYPEGAVFRVVAEGARLNGLTPMRGGHRGWSRPLEVGTEIVCTGVRWGWGSDPGLQVEFKCDEPGVSYVTFWPAAYGAMMSYPAPGSLERVR